MNNDIFKKLEAMYREHPVMCAKPCTQAEVNSIEDQIGFTLPNSYKDFVRQFGGAIVGPFSVFGKGSSVAMSSTESCAVSMTNSFRKQQWPGTENWLVVSCDHSGNPVGINANGEIWISDHDAGTIQKLCDSFDDYLVRCLQSSQR